MPTLNWTAEGGTDGVTITPGNSGGASGNAWDTSQIGANATNQYDNAFAANGSLSALIATGVTSTQAYNRWQAAIAALWPAGMTTNYGRCYLRISAIPPADQTFVEMLDPTATTNRGNIRVRSTGAVRIRNAANGTVVTSATILSVDTWYRFEWRIDGSTTGAWQLLIFLGNSAIPIESLSGTADFGGVIGAYQFGITTNTANAAPRWFDGIQVNDTGLPGPQPVAGTAIPRSGRWLGSWAADGMVPAFRVTDDFADSSLDTDQWDLLQFGSVTGAEGAGTYDFTVADTGTGGGFLTAWGSHDITGDAFTVELASAGVQEAGLQAYGAEFQIDSNNRIFMTVAAGFIGMFQTVGGVQTDHGFVAYNPVNHRWFRLRESGGVTYWEAGPDGLLWATLASAANPIATDSVLLRLGADTFLTLGSSKTVSFGHVGAP